MFTTLTILIAKVGDGYRIGTTTNVKDLAHSNLDRRFAVVQGLSDRAYTGKIYQCRETARAEAEALQIQHTGNSIKPDILEIEVDFKKRDVRCRQ